MAETDNDQGDMGICKNTQEEIKAGFLVAVVSQGSLPEGQTVKIYCKDSI